jgi:hypothetical protein
LQIIFACCQIHVIDVYEKKRPGKHRKNCWTKKAKSLRINVECSAILQIRGEKVEK